MTVPRELLNRSQPTRGCRGCGGHGLGYTGEPCLMCPGEAKRIADEEYERSQRWQNQKWTPEQAMDHIRQAIAFWPMLHPMTPAPSEEELFNHFVEQGKIVLPEPLFVANLENAADVTVLVEAFHRTVLDDAYSVAKGDPRRIQEIIKERLNAALE